MRRLLALAAGAALLLAPAAAAAQSLTLDLGEAADGSAATRIVQLTALIALLSRAPPSAPRARRPTRC